MRRATRRSLGAYLREEIAAPLGLDCWVGLPAAELSRAARILPPEAPGLLSWIPADSLMERVMSGPSGLFAYDEMWNRPEVLAAEMPSSNGVTSARALARLYATCVGEIDGARLLAPATVAAATRVHAEGPDRVLLLPTRYGAGFMLSPMLAPACGPRAFGHTGAGGSLGFADPEAQVAFGYVTTRAGRARRVARRTRLPHRRHARRMDRAAPRHAADSHAGVPARAPDSVGPVGGRSACRTSSRRSRPTSSTRSRACGRSTKACKPTRRSMKRSDPSSIAHGPNTRRRGCSAGVCGSTRGGGSPIAIARPST
ncbi:MAG: beta-lactamase family protein [Deltaproteobacteria bacterium]|nr:beta-lactamase family protein [Deltaproteobacteria bacterium]